MVRSDGRGQREPGGGEPSEDAVRALLAELAPLTAPDAAERSRMRERVLAGLAKPTPSPRAPSPRPPRAGRAPRGRRTAGVATRPADEPRTGFGARGRFAVAAVAVLALVFSLAGMSLLLARDALPGDPLYGIKRTGEAASLGLTFGDEDRAFKHLEFATARVTELETLARRYADPADAPLRSYLASLTDFNHDAAAGSRSLTAIAVVADGALLRTLGEWAEVQRLRLGALPVPVDAVAPRAVSIALLERIATRAGTLSARMSCTQVTSGGVDDVGALPATSPCVPAPTPGTTATTSAPSAPAPTGHPGRTLGGPTTPGGPEPTAPSGTIAPSAPSVPLSTTPDGTTTVDPNPPLPLPTIGVPALVPGLGAR
ncbi:hypothetical protein GCM10010171_13680 [Actinokineospora fastidiosa]|uniref:DUF5667 domain-containing protein n=1 Tax=Actinokineospora fastidiosa TaxID=1816 RepID=A0A918G6J6_9PSEU|nr:hypothetical protein GCM10010171_13680 [Actinokineospora fastidiosa]